MRCLDQVSTRGKIFFHSPPMHEIDSRAKLNGFRPPAQRLGELDVLRGLAAFAVMIFHYTVRYHELFAPGGPVLHGSSLGENAVHLFFMISGFVIFMTLSKTRTALDFVVSRFSRLFPVYWVAVLLTFTVVSVSPLPGRTPTLTQLIVNLTMLQKWLHFPEVDGVYWTLAIELSFYAIMLGVFLAGQLRRIEWLVIPWLLCQCTWAVLGHKYDLPKIVEISLLLKYAHLFLAGILFYRLRIEGAMPLRHSLLVCCLGIQFLLQGATAGLFTTGFFAAFYALTFGRLNWIAKRPLVLLGAISYSLYLVHQNIGYVIMRRLESFPRSIQIGTAIAASLLMASGLTFFIERPSLRAIRDFYKKQRFPDAEGAGVSTAAARISSTRS
jgi:peptidoglycan/LPS O-acetylase OafA/YrhL